MNAQQIAAINVAKREYQKEYLEYWNSTSELTGTGRPVDGFFCPVAPFPAAQRGKAYYAGYTVFANLLDYGSIVIPVTIADKTADTIDAGYDPLNDMDKAIHDEYDAEIYDGAHVGLQLVGRRFQEERLIALAEYVGHAVRTA
ncbi:amidase [Histoplasma capsulatum var. duboisii H88]|nr:amidase [Histoplasma capsulatum H143]EGC49495.1 amidase [Histoplasma capsulatum var. duboisii H88]